jgi:hypothetical protein
MRDINKWIENAEKDLILCHFCGSKAKIDYIEGEGYSSGIFRFYVYCCEDVDNKEEYENGFNNLQDLIIEWNKNNIKGYCNCCGAPNINGKQEHDDECIYKE